MNKVLSVAVAIVAVIAIWLGIRHFGTSVAQLPSASASPTASTTVSPSITAGPFPTDVSKLSKQQLEQLVQGVSLRYSPVPLESLSGPATCKAEGGIQFVKQNTYITNGAKVSWTGIDHPARIFKWTVTPKDGLRIGPNMLANLPIPDGSSEVGVTLPAHPVAKRYTLTPTVTYSRLVNGAVKDYEATCSGHVTVDLTY